MGLIDELRRRIGRGTWEDGGSHAHWREALAALRREPGVTDADIARAVRQLVQGRAASGALEEHAAVRALAQRLFVETARVSPRGPKNVTLKSSTSRITLIRVRLSDRAHRAIRRRAR